MEEEKKRRKNKKKKNKQPNRTATTPAPIPDGHQEDPAAHHHHHQEGEEGEEEEGAVSNGELQSHHNGVAFSSTTAEAEKLEWLQKEAILQTTIKQMQSEIDSRVQNEGNLEQIIRQIEAENALHISKEAALEETVKQLTKASRSWFQKEATCDEKIRQLQDENDAHQQKEAGLEQKVNQLLDEKAILASNMVSLEEKVEQLENEKDSWILKETTTKDTLARMKVDSARLQMQVVELEESRNSLLKGNQQLVETVAGLEDSRNYLLMDKQQLLDSISELQLQLRNLQTGNSNANTSYEVGKDDLISQIEAASTLVDKLIMENAELVEKVNELYIQLDRRGTAPALDVRNDLVEKAEIASETADAISETNESISPLGQKTEKFETEPVEALQFPSESECGEIVQIPLEDDGTDVLERQDVLVNRKDDVPLSDAPLIGAPFRLISFVANYVSGADLVNKDALT